MPGKGILGHVPPCYFKNVWYMPPQTGHKYAKHPKSISFDMTPYPYLLVLDFEANCLEKGELPCQEIIEFPVVPVDVVNMKIMHDKTFHYYIKPSVVPNITEFCTRLTGITQAKVDGGISIQDALNRLDVWMADHGFDKGNSTFVTVSRTDLLMFLKNEADYKNIRLPDYLKKFINITDIFKSTLHKEKASGMIRMLSELNINLTGNHHSGIDDTRNTAKIVIDLLRRGALLSKTQDVLAVDK